MRGFPFRRDFARARAAPQAKRDRGARLAKGARICNHPKMASDHGIVAFILEQIASAGDVRARPMFGEYGLYCDDRMIAMVCDDQLFVKPTPGGRAYVSAGADAGTIDEAPPYPGAKPCLLIDADRWDDADWLAGLVRISAAEIPLPKPKTPKLKAPKTPKPRPPR